MVNIFKRVFNRLRFMKADKDRTGSSVSSGAIAQLSPGYFSTLFNAVLARRGGALETLTDEMVKGFNRNTLREIISESSPMVSKAASDFVYWSNSGWNWAANSMEADRGVGSPAHNLLETFVTRLFNESDGLDNILNAGYRSMFVHGAIFTELVFDKDKKTPVTLKVLDPTSACFRQRTDSVRGQYYELGQQQYNSPEAETDATGFVSLQDVPTVQYRPILPVANYPYGLSMIDPAIFTVVMSSGFFSNFNQALNAQIWPTNLITIDREKFKESVRTGSPDELQSKMKLLMKDIIDKVQKLKPGGVAVYGDEVAVGDRLSGVNRANFGSVRDIHDVMDREGVRGIGSQPILLGRNEGVSETHADLQLISYGKLITNSQRIMGDLFTYYFNLILYINRFPKLAKFLFRSLNTAEYRDRARTMTEIASAMKMSNESLSTAVEALDMAVESGYMSREEAQMQFDAEIEVRRRLEMIPRETE